MFKPRDSEIIQDIRKARSLKELSLIADRIGSKIKQHKSLVFRLLSNLSKLFSKFVSKSSDEIIEIGQDDDKPRLGNIDTKTGQALIKNWKQPKLKVLQTVLREVDEFNQRSYELKELRATLIRDYPKLKKAREQALAGVENYLDQAAEALDVALSQLEKISKKIEQQHAPDQLRSWVKSLRNYLEKSLPEEQFDLIEAPKLYLAEQKDAVLFQYYIQIHGLVNSDNYTPDDYYIVVTGKVASTAVITFYVTSMERFEVPGTFAIGRQVKHQADLFKTTLSMLKVDRVLPILERKPMALNTEHMQQRMSNIKGIIKTRLLKDELFVFITKSLAKPTASNEQKLADIKNQVIEQLSTLIGSARNKHSVFNSKFEILSKPRQEAGIVLRVILTPVKSKLDMAGPSAQQFNQVADALGLDIDTLRLLKKFMAKHGTF